MLPGCFSQLYELLQNQNVGEVDGIVFDIGVSSMQIDDGNRGFSFQIDGPLDMRMDSSSLSNETSAYDIVNNYSQDDLANIIYKYGEEKKSRIIARTIVEERLKTKISSTLQLVEIIKKALGVSAAKYKIHPATRTFQALRIYINNELDELSCGLHAAACLLRKGGRLVIVSFHSLEDRIVKRFLNYYGGKLDNNSRYLPQLSHDVNIIFQPVNKPVIPTEDEVFNNPRARSAKLRSAIKFAECNIEYKPNKW